MKISNVYCLFEQSGTFKNEFKKLGYNAYDYDILNDFNETDYQIDLYNEIEKCYSGCKNIFDNFNETDLIIAFFPCIRFEQQILLNFRGDNYAISKWSLDKKLENDMILQMELTHNYNILNKLVLICLKRNLRLIIENPYSTQSYLITHWALKPNLIINDRRDYGDYFVKPTMFYFINCNVADNFIFESRNVNEYKRVCNAKNKVERSLMSPDFANRFIREFIL